MTQCSHQQSWPNQHPAWQRSSPHKNKIAPLASLTNPRASSQSGKRRLPHSTPVQHRRARDPSNEDAENGLTVFCCAHDRHKQRDNSTSDVCEDQSLVADGHERCQHHHFHHHHHHYHFHSISGSSSAGSSPFPSLGKCCLLTDPIRLRPGVNFIRQKFSRKLHQEELL